MLRPGCATLKMPNGTLKHFRDYLKLDGLRHKETPAARLAQPDEMDGTPSIAQNVKSATRSQN